MKKDCLVLIILSLLIFGFNLVVIHPYLPQESPRWIESIEVSYITMGRFLAQNFPHISFNPVWYLGFPMALMYVPLVPFGVAILGKIIGSFGLAYHSIVGIAYALVPVTLFLFIYFLTKNRLASFIGITWFSLAPSVGYILAEVRAVQGLFSHTLPHWRMVVMVFWGEGPHTLAMVFLPLAGLFFLWAFRQRSLGKIFWAAFFTAITALANPIGLYGLGILLGAIFLVGLLYQEDRASVVRIAALVAILSYLLSAFWYTVSFIVSDLGEGGGLIKVFLSYFPWGTLGIILGFSLFLYLIRHFISDESQAISILWFGITFFIVFAFYRWGISFAPQARRFIPEADMALAALISLGVASLGKKLKQICGEKRLSLVAEPVLGFLLLAIIFSLTRRVWQASWWFTGPDKRLEELVEYEMAQYLETQNPSRVFVSANHTFWLNYFTDIWQVRGGYWQAATNPWIDHAFYQITSHPDGETSILWLKAFGVSHVVVNMPHSLTHYRDFRFPHKFENLLEPVWENEGDLVYRVPLPFMLTGAVYLNQMEEVPSPQKGDDKQALKSYIAWIEKPTESKLDLKMVNNDLYQIQGSIKQDEGVLMQLTYDPAFRAQTASGKKVIILKDPLGFMVLIPPEAGEVKIFLRYGSTWDRYLGFILTLGSIVGLSFWAIKEKQDAKRSKS